MNATGPQSRAMRDKDRTLEALLIDYQIARDDDRNSAQMLLNFLGIGITMMALLAAFISKACSAEAWDSLQTFTQCDTAIPRPLFAFIPLAIGALLGWVAINGVTATEQNYYMRELELQILEILGDDEDSSRLRMPSYSNMTARFLSQTRGPFAARFLVFTMYATVGLLGIGIAVVCLLITQPVWLQVGASLVYLGVVAAIIRLTVIGSYSSSGTWQMMGPDLDAELQRTRQRRINQAKRPDSSRSLVTYLLLPRPPEILMKSVFVAGGLVFSTVVFGESSSRALWLEVCMAVFILEYLVYQARYTLNDLAGAEGDAKHPGLVGGRFPTRDGELSPTDAGIALLVSLLRVALALALTVVWYEGPQRAILLGAIIAVGVLSIVYDRLRDHNRERAEETEAPYSQLTRPSSSSSAVFVLVGGGYALRVFTGLSLGSGQAPWLFLATALVSFWVFGIMFVTMTWAVDVAFYLGDPDDDGHYPLSERVRNHPHYGPIAQQAFGRAGSVLTLNGTLTTRCAIPTDWRPRKDEDSPWKHLLHIKPLQNLRHVTWWSVSLLLSAGGMAALAGLILRLDAAPIVALGVATAVLTQVLYGRGRAALLMGLPVVGAAVSLWMTDRSAVTAIAAWIPLAAAYGTFLAFQGLDPQHQRARVREWLEPLGDWLLIPVALVVVALIGRNPWPELNSHHHGDRPAGTSQVESTKTDAASAATEAHPLGEDQSSETPPEADRPEAHRSTPDRR